MLSRAFNLNTLKKTPSSYQYLIYFNLILIYIFLYYIIFIEFKFMLLN